MELMMTNWLDFTQALKASGLTLGWLMLIGALFLVTLVLSARELLLWYLKINHLHGEIAALREALARLESKLGADQAVNPTTLFNSAKRLEFLDAKPAANREQKFPLTPAEPR